ncbi:MAG: hypothetical protein KGL35_10620, partial [Bradyrhizobium sp.]|nr:hypothetical protein [Bradyrhizobium sp.]
MFGETFGTQQFHGFGCRLVQGGVRNGFLALSFGESALLGFEPLAFGLGGFLFLAELARSLCALGVLALASFGTLGVNAALFFLASLPGRAFSGFASFTFCLFFGLPFGALRFLDTSRLGSLPFAFLAGEPVSFRAHGFLFGAQPFQFRAFGLDTFGLSLGFQLPFQRRIERGDCDAMLELECCRQHVGVELTIQQVRFLDQFANLCRRFAYRLKREALQFIKASLHACLSFTFGLFLGG